MKRRPRSRFSLSLRITLTFGIGALVVSTCVAVSSYVFAVRFLVRQQERSALHLAYLNAATVKPRLTGDRVDVPAALDALATGSSSSSIIYTTHRWFSSSLLVSRDAVPTAVRTAASEGAVVRAWTHIGGAPQIVVGVPLPAVDSTFFQVVDESSLARTISVLRSVLFAAASVTTAAGGVFGWRASRRLTAPLRAVDAAARRVMHGDLETRLPEERDAELAGLVASFNAMVEALHDRIARDARFAADVSHELRSPLTTVRTALSVLTARQGELSARSQDALTMLCAELDRFGQLVDDLLEISRMDAADALDPEPVRISALVLNMLNREHYRGVEASFDGDGLEAVVLGEKRRLEQALRNLLDNAADYGGGATRVTTSGLSDAVVIAVDDAGPGVATAERDLVFERFTRGRHAGGRASHGGTGLGLALVREHVSAHNGRVYVTDAPDGGARFVIELPRARP